MKKMRAKKSIGDVTSLNVTLLRAGMQAGGEDVMNVVPAKAEVGFDIRISPHIPPKQIADTIDTWCQEVTASTTGLPKGGGLSWEYTVERNPLKTHNLTATDDTNPWWVLFEGTLRDECGVSVKTEVFPAATDSRFLRALGVRALGFSPMRNSPILLHEHDEYLDESVFVEGCNVYVTLIRGLARQGTF
jgi:aminoacylase